MAGGELEVHVKACSWSGSTARHDPLSAQTHYTPCFVQCHPWADQMHFLKRCLRQSSGHIAGFGLGRQNQDRENYWQTHSRMCSGASRKFSGKHSKNTGTLPNIKDVEKGFFSPQSMKAGADVHVLFYQDAQPHVLAAKVGGLTPMALTTSDPKVHLLKPSMRSILVGEEWHVQVDVSAWEELDRRRYPRHPVDLPVKLRLVIDGDDSPSITEILAVMKDLSLGGALIESGEEIAAGTLVELQAALRAKDHIRVLAVVIREVGGDKTYGLEFLDFVGGSRYAMHGFLTEAA
jgi:hypothetical protein